MSQYGDLHLSVAAGASRVNFVWACDIFWVKLHFMQDMSNGNREAAGFCQVMQSVRVMVTCAL